MCGENRSVPVGHCNRNLVPVPTKRKKGSATITEPPVGKVWSSSPRLASHPARSFRALVFQGCTNKACSKSITGPRGVKRPLHVAALQGLSTFWNTVAVNTSSRSWRRPLTTSTATSRSSPGATAGLSCEMYGTSTCAEATAVVKHGALSAPGPISYDILRGSWLCRCTLLVPAITSCSSCPTSPGFGGSP